MSTLAAANALLEPSLIARLATAALTALEEIARTGKDPTERRRAATTILRFLSARRPSPRTDSPGTTPRTNADISTVQSSAASAAPAAAHARATPHTTTPAELQAAPPFSKTPRRAAMLRAAAGAPAPLPDSS